jgi:hypothetical protein
MDMDELMQVVEVAKILMLGIQAQVRIKVHI